MVEMLHNAFAIFISVEFLNYEVRFFPGLDVYADVT
jgi:hypothetical protein